MRIEKDEGRYRLTQQQQEEEEVLVVYYGAYGDDIPDPKCGI